MALTLLRNALVLVNGANLSGYSNKAEITSTVAEEDATTFASAGFKEVAAGLFSHAWSLEGFWNAGDASLPDDRLWTDLGTTAAWTMTPSSTEGTAAFFGTVLSAGFKFGGQVGNLAGYTGTGMGSGRLVDGTLMAGPGTARTATGTGTAVQLGALSATQSMYAAAHVCSVSGTLPTVVLKLQSASTSGGSYTDRITFSSANTVSSQTGTVAGAVTDTWWRASWTITGTTPSFLIAVAAGIA